MQFHVHAGVNLAQTSMKLKRRPLDIIKFQFQLLKLSVSHSADDFVEDERNVFDNEDENVFDNHS
jgi:hypothetical protein